MKIMSWCFIIQKTEIIKKIKRVNVKNELKI